MYESKVIDDGQFGLLAKPFDPKLSFRMINHTFPMGYANQYQVVKTKTPMKIANAALPMARCLKSTSDTHVL